MMAAGEDPYSFLANHCQLPPSDLLKLRDYPVLRESETSPSLDLDSDTDFEQTPLSSTPTELTRIHMVSPPESESDSDEDTPSIDRIAPFENDVFHTPPDHYNRRSSSSSQEFHSQREKPAANGVIDEHIQSTVCVDDGVHLEGDENLEVQGTAELDESEEDLDTHCSENVMGVNGIVRTETNLKRYSVLVDQLREFSKKIRASPSTITDCLQPEGDETLGVPGMAELDKSDGDSEIDCSQNVMGGNKVVQTETNLNRYSVLVDELREFSKKIMGSKEKPDCDTPSSITDFLQPEGDETLGVPGMASLDKGDGDSEIHCSQNVMGSNRVVRTETNLNRYSVLVDELREFSKKIRGSKEKPDCDTPSAFTNRLQPEGDETLGVPGMAGLDKSDGDSEIHCSQNAMGVNRVVRTETSLNRYSLLVDDLREFSKKIRVSKENRNCDTLSPGQTDNQVDCTEKSVLDKGKVVVLEDSSTQDIGGNSEKSLYVGSDTGPGERMEEKAVEEEDRVEPCSMDNVDSASGKSAGGLKDIENEGISVTHVDLTAMDLEENGGISIERLSKKAVEEPCSFDNLDSAARKSFGGNRDSKNEDISVIDLDSMEENDEISMQNEGLENYRTTLDCEITRVEGTKELIDRGSDGGGVVNNEKVDEVCLVMSTVDLSVNASLKVVAMEENTNKQNDGESCSGGKNTKEIESFRYEGCVSDRNNPGKEVVVCRGRRELPLSVGGGKENEPRNPKGKKRSWQELIGAFEVYFKMDESSEEVDFLETAKRRGLTFP